MDSAACVVQIGRFAMVLLAVGSCSGQVVRLGDGPPADSAIASGGTDVGGGRPVSGSDGTTDIGTCLRGQVKANAVLWIGDSWIDMPGVQHTLVRDLARAAGAIGPEDDYVDQSAAASTLSMIVDQYHTQEAGAVKVKVLIMDGGTWDTILTNGADSTVTKVNNSFQEFLTKVASDGTVEHIVYYLMPELPTIPGVAALRPGLVRACAESLVPCHFLDLQPLWAGHPEYTASDGIQASVAGAEVIANEIWTIMQQHCIAQ